jgi:MerR family transcriptional regulator, light-induced transcriptional regulator
MDQVKSIFSIKDLENLSGIKAHTIRIWEKRYDVLQPMRTDSNIRYYDLAALQKLLNITLLHNYGYKISKISKLEDSELNKMIRGIITEKSAKNHALNAFKMSMMNFDQALFLNTYNELLGEKSFREVFFEVFIPLMEELGFLWQTDTITPAHEHFITFLIKQKLLIQTEKVQVKEPENLEKTFVLYLPVNEIHELGLMYLNFEILDKGFKAIYLGESVPADNLPALKKYFNNLVYVTYITVEPDKDEINPYLKNLTDLLITEEDDTEIWVLGRQVEFIKSNHHPKLKTFQSIKEFSRYL